MVQPIRLSICSSSFTIEQPAAVLYEGYNEKELWSQIPWNGIKVFNELNAAERKHFFSKLANNQTWEDFLVSE